MMIMSKACGNRCKSTIDQFTTGASCGVDMLLQETNREIKEKVMNSH